MPHLTAAQLALLRAQGQKSEWYIYPLVPATVFAARINDPAITVGANTIPFDSVTTGAWGDIVAGMTLYVGTAPGGYNVARIRVRSATSAHIVVAQNADVAWADNLYLTVKRQWLPWAVRPFINDSGVTFKDFDIAWAGQTTDWPPVAMMGDPACHFFDDDPRAWFDGSESYPVAPGATIVGWLWDFGDGTTSTAMVPGWHTYPAAGDYYPSLTVLDSNGETHTRRGIAALPLRADVYTAKFEAQSFEGTIDGGWDGGFAVRDPDASLSHFPEWAAVFLFGVDWYGQTAGSAGYPKGRENVRFFGYIQQDSVRVNAEVSEVVFDAESLSAIMARNAGYPAGLVDATTPASWTDGLSLNIFRAMVYLLKFQSTVMDVADVALVNDTTPAKIVDFPEGSLWEQLTQFAKGRRLLRCGVSRTGRLQVGSDPNLLAVAARGAVPVVCQLQTGDWIEDVTIPEEPYPRTDFLCLSGLAYDAVPANDPTPLFGMSPGHPPKEHGDTRTLSALALNSQNEANTFAGLLVGQDNNAYGLVVVPLMGNWLGALEPAFQEYIQAPAGGFVTNRGVQLAGQYLIIRKVSMAFDWEAGFMRAQIECEVYSYPEIATNGDCWPAEAPPPPDSLFPIDTIIPPPEPALEIGVTVLSATACYPTATAVLLRWTRLFNVDGYHIYRDSVLIATVTGAGVLSYQDSGLTELTAYDYEVAGFKADVEGDLSNLVTVTTCDLPVQFHNHVIMFTPNHVLEFSAFGGYGIESDVPVDIKGNVSGTLLGAHVDASGNILVLTETNVWRYMGGSTWAPSVHIDDFSVACALWNHEYFPTEDCAGPHGPAYYNTPFANACHPLPEGDGDINYNCQAVSLYQQLVGGAVTLKNFFANLDWDCSILNTGIWSAALAAELPLPIAGIGATTPDVFNHGLGSFLPFDVRGHFSPYPAETFHDFVGEGLVVVTYFDGADVSGTFSFPPKHVTDHSGSVWAWDGDQALRKSTGGAFAVSLASGRISYGLFAFNAAPGTLKRRTVNGPDMWFSTNDGTSWTLAGSGDDNAQNIFTADDQPDNLYVISDTGRILTSPNEGVNWWENYAGVGENAIGLWVDTAS